MNFVLYVVRDLVNGSKHFRLTDESVKKRRVNKVHTGIESGWYSWLFHEDLPAVTAEEHWYFTIRSLNNIIIRYFEWVFDDSSPVKCFPKDLLEAILYCNVAKRGGARPNLLLSEKTMTTGIQNKLTGQIGEHLVSAMLGTMSFYASPYSGNIPGFDITAVNAETLESFPIQVKTSNGRTLVHSRINKWVEHRNEKKGKDNYQYIGKPLKLQYPDKIWIMVNLTNNNLKSARYFICKEIQIQKKIVANYEDFLAKHNNRRPSGSASTHAGLDIIHLEEYEDNWKILSERRGASE